MLVRAAVFKGQPMPQMSDPGDLEGGNENILAGGLATAGAGTWTGALIANGIINRTGIPADETDTTDTASNILSALAGSLNSPLVEAGTTFRLIVRNTVAHAITWAAGVGVVAGTGTLDIAASLVREYIVTVLNNSGNYILNSNTTNASAVVTFNFPTGQTAFKIGSADPQALNLSPGATVSGTGITAGTTVLGVTQGQGGITGVTLSANATATSAGGVALTFGPTVKFDGLRSSTL